MSTFIKTSAFLFIISFVISGCYTKLALENERPTYREKNFSENSQSNEDINDNSAIQNNEDNTSYDYEYNDNYPVINNYYFGNNDWWPHPRLSYSYYWPSSSFWFAYNDPWYDDWNYSWYYQPYYYSYGWCGTRYATYNPWSWHYYPGHYSYYPYYYGYWYDSPTQTVKSVRNFGRTRADGISREDRNSYERASESHPGSVDLPSGVITGGRIDGNSFKKNSNDRDTRSGRTVRDNSGRRGPRDSRARSPRSGRDYRPNQANQPKVDVESQSPRNDVQPRQNENPSVKRDERTQRNFDKPSNTPQQRTASPPPQQNKGNTSRKKDE
ncbi:MAG: hypothetical protein FJ218_01645 [Ignavibacteria bacterium]|nr:hypothetical protein [Ignavibacteria bacterium]